MYINNLINYYEENGELPEDINNLSDRTICKLLDYKIEFINELKASRIDSQIANKLLELDVEEFIIFIDYIKEDSYLYNNAVRRYIDKTGLLPENLEFRLLKSENKRKIIEIDPSYISKLYDSERNYFYFRRCLGLTDEQILYYTSYFPASSYEDYSCSLLVCNNFDYFKNLSLEIKKNINLEALVASSLEYSELSEQDKNIIVEKLNNASCYVLRGLYNKCFLEYLDKEQKLNFKITWYRKSYSKEEKIKILEIFEEDEFEVLLEKDLSSIMYAPEKFITNERWLNAFEYVMSKPFIKTDSYFWKKIPIEILDQERIYRIVDTHVSALDYLELKSINDDKYWEIIEKRGCIKDTQVRLFIEKFRPEKMDIVLNCFSISSLLASYKPLLDEVNEENIGIFLTVSPESLKYLPLNQKLVYSFCLYNPDFIRNLFASEFNQYLDKFLLELFVTKANNVRLSEIPQKYLTEELVLLALQRSDKAISKLSAKSKTQMMLSVEANRDKNDTSLIDNFKDKLSVINEQQKEIDKYFKLKSDIVKNLPILIKYFEDSNISISKFCIENNIDENLFKRLINEIGKLEQEVMVNYKQLANVHKKEGWNYIIDTAKFVEESISKGVKSPEKDEVIPFKPVLYYIYCSMDVDRLLEGLKSINNKFLYRMLKRLLNIENPTINDFNTTEFVYKGKHLAKNEKEQIKIFMKEHKIPMDTKMATQIFYLWQDGHLDILKKYKPTHSYIFDDATRESISIKAQKIRMQRVIIERLDAKIMSIREEMEGVIKR